ncbi:MAG TPA: hypothetical protein DCQ83_03800 [Fibrobacteres bacterium]|nr:hypothetical protein [Fibrobacterota bacterium]
MRTSFYKSTLLSLALAGLSTAALKDSINTLTYYEQAQGFKLLFDSTANSFRNNFVNYAQNGTTTTTLNAGWTMDTTFSDPDRPGVFFRAIKTTAAITDNRTKTMYKDMDLRMEYRNNGNEGVVYRFDLSYSSNWGTGIELGIDDNLNQRGWITAGAAYEVYAPIPQPYLTFNTGKWNTLRLVVKADSVEHWLNGVKVVSFRYWSQSFRDSVAKSKWATTNAARFCQTANNNKTYIPLGYWGFQADHGGAWQIRKLRVLHDSDGTPNRVKLGPVDTVTGVFALMYGPRAKPEFHLEGTSQGLLVSAVEGTLRSVELLSLDGRLAKRVSVSGTKSDLIVETNGLQKGVYLLKMRTSKGTIQGKALIQ